MLLCQAVSWDPTATMQVTESHMLLPHHVYPGFQAQVSVHGPPLQLSPEEVTLALQHGALTPS